MKRRMSIALSLLLALGLCLCLCAAAAEIQGQPPVQLTVRYTSANGGPRPQATFAFTVVKKDGDAAGYPEQLPSVGSVTFNAASGETQEAAITLPEYPSAGTYEYIIRQKTPDTPISGLTYYSAPIHMKVTVAYGDQGELIRVAALRPGAQDDTGAKGSLIENQYESGALRIAKVVTGNMGERDRYFDVKVTLAPPAGTAPASDSPIAMTGGSSPEGQPDKIGYNAETTLKIKDGETIILSNVAAGTTYTVVEADYTGEGGGYERAQYTWSDEEKKVSPGDTDTVTITNRKEVELDTGIRLDDVPYLAALALALAGGALLLKRRSRRKA